MRIDLYLFQKGFAESRQKAKGLLEDSLVTVNGKTVTKASYDVTENDSVALTGTGLRYVGRGGLKLEGALKQFHFDPCGAVAADIGASTGGFTDCLLQNGAERVYAIDAGTNQLHEKLRNDPRVVSLENCNAKLLNDKMIPEKISLVVMDLSFISQTAVYPALTQILKDEATLISLVKPQFEAGKGEVGKNGIVRNKKAHADVLKKIMECADQYRLRALDVMCSPITGGDGNIEYLVLFRYSSDSQYNGAYLKQKDKIHKVVFGESK